jgi:hypothetical protein
MTRSPRFWRISTVLFILGNAGGAVLAFAMREQMHAELHLALMGAGYVGYLFLRASQRKKEVQANQELPAGGATDPRIEYLQQSVDAIALEVERMGEAQRFQEKLRAERKETMDEPKN